MLRILLLALFVVFPACEKSKDKKTSDSPAASRPSQTNVKLGDVVATLQLPAGDSIGELAPLIDKVQPGVSAMAAAQIPMLLAKLSGASLMAADLSKPVSLVVLNPKKHKDPVAILVSVKDLKKLEASAESSGLSLEARDGLALIGAPEVVEAAQAFAFAKLAQPSRQIEGVVYPAPLSAIYADEFAAGIAEMNKTMAAMSGAGEGFGKIMELYQQAGTSVAKQTDRVVLRLGTSGNSADLHFQIYPNKGSELAAFVDAQVPTDHELLGKLPPSDGHMVVFSGDMRAGAARGAIVDFGIEAMGAMYESKAVEPLAWLMGPFMDTFKGNVAMTMSMNLDPGQGELGMSMNYLMGATDAAAMRKGWHQMFELLKTSSKDGGSIAMMGMQTELEMNKKVFEFDGVEVDHYHSKINLDSVDPTQRAAMEAMGSAQQDMHFATFDELGLMTTAGEGQERIKAMISAARGKADTFQLSSGLASAIAESSKRKESLLMFMDMQSFAQSAPSPIPLSSMVMAMGKEGEALTMRMSIGM